MKYLLLYNQNEAAFDALDDAGKGALVERYMKYGKEIAASGIMSAGEKLNPTKTATTVRVRDGKRIVTDGPFAETEEQIAGFALIDVPDLDHAIEWAANHPDAEWASVEIRPVVEWKA